MKSSAINISRNQLLIVDATAFKINESIMKKLTSTSPFLLLLLPVFIMMLLLLSVNTSQNNNEEIVAKPAGTSVSVVKQATLIFK